MRDLFGKPQTLGEQGVSQAASERLTALMEPLSQEVKIKGGRDLFVKGDAADALYVVREGLMEIGTHSDDGRRLAHIVIRPGAVFGEVALFDGGTRSATVTAQTDTIVWRIAASKLLTEMEISSEIAIELLKLTVGRLRWMSAQLEDQTFETVETRLARRLTFLLQTMGNEGLLSISQSQLAEHVGASREAVSKVMNEWKDAGVIEIGRGRIKLLDPEALFQAAAYGYTAHGSQPTYQARLFGLPNA